MATYPKIIKPWRGYPSANVVHGMRVHVNMALPNSQLGHVGLVPGRAHHVGTLPRGCFVLPAAKHTIVAFNGTTPTVKVGTKTVADAYTGGTALDTVGFDDLVQGVGMGYTVDDTPVYILLAGTGTINAGEVDFVLPFYINRD
jgi:hypothetical protein